MEPVMELIDSGSESLKTTDISVSELIHLRDSFYTNHKKNMLFKKTQKMECAESLCNQIPLDKLMDQTFWIVPNKNQLYFDYRVFKLFGNPQNYMIIVDNVLRFCRWCVNEYDGFEIHVNLHSFTISGAERYKDIIVLFCDECMKRDTRFSQKLITMNLHNVPQVVDNISKLLMPLMPIEVRPKIIIHSREHTAEMLTQLFQESGKIYNP